MFALVKQAWEKEKVIFQSNLALLSKQTWAKMPAKLHHEMSKKFLKMCEKYKIKTYLFLALTSTIPSRGAAEVCIDKG